MDCDDQDPYPNHKLCGFLATVLTIPPPISALPFLSPCHPSSDGLFFVSQNDSVVLSPLPHPLDAVVSPKKRAGKRGSGMVNGSVSVVNQILSLVSHKCIKVIVRVLHVSVSESGDDVRVAVLVDVYLPVRLWSGWQFPKAKAIAGSLFKHLSCDWGKRSAMLEGEFCGNLDGGVKSLWNISDCHVLGCQVHCDVPDSSKKMRFDLHEVFKNLPSVTNNEHFFSSRVTPVGNACGSGLWDVTDDILMNILALIGPMDLVRVAATCHHLRSLAVRIMPCMKLKLFPHQQAAVEWMLHRESKGQVLPHPLYAAFSTEDGLSFYVNTVSGEIVYGIAPTIRDFSGGMFCDEPGLGKTITALSLILKTQGKIADPPDGAQVTWCTHNGKQKCGYYELSGSKITSDDASLRKRVMNQSARRVHISLGEFTLVDDQSYSTPKRARLVDPNEEVMGLKEPSSVKGACVLSASYSEPAARVVRRTRSLNHVKNNLLHSYGEASGFGNQRKVGKKSTRRKCGYDVPKYLSMKQEVDLSCTKAAADYLILNETWIQCDACRKWRKITETVGDSNAAWFCSMNADPSHQSCGDPEEDWGKCESITYFPGFCSKGTLGGNEQNVSFFISVLKEDYSAINSKTKKALTWLAKLSPERLALMESYGLASPAMGTNCSASGNVDTAGFQKVFQAFGLVRRVEKGVIKWYYPCTLENLEFDLAALRIALREPLDSVRLYLSGATLIIVPANLVDHWKTQILKHVKPDQLRVRILIDNRKPSAHSLAWDYDVVITTFNRLSVEWGPHKKSPLMQVHWHRVLLDEGHTLGASVNLTNKLQMAISLPASSRWLLTGTPTPNTPNSQLSHLHPLLKFLHEEAYGQDSKSWEAGILRPFEAEMEEGRLQLLQLLGRCLISARKSDLKTIPPCIKKATFLDFTKEHAKSYNELVVTVRRNILLADWNDPSHVESLLNPKQWKFRSATVRNVRLSCCVAGHIKVSDAGEDIQETMDDLVAKGLDPISQEYALIKYHLQYGGNCLKCHEWCRLPIITPCRHLLCLDCAALNSEMCCVHGCDNLYEMQQPQKLTRPENPNPKWPVPKDLIELQPSYKQDDWDPDWQSTSSSKVSYLVQRLKSLQGANSEGGCSIDDDSGARYNEDRIRSPQMTSTLQQQDSKRPEPYKTVQEKVIIFSQFLEHIHVIAQQLTFANIKFAGLYCPMPSTNKVKALATFQHDATCMVLLMDGSAALGLDLSFVTHVFLMEPIWDKSMEEQVISRAHRMGASRPIHVETLAMRGTIEEQMLKFLQDGEDCKKLLNEESVKADHDGARTHRSLHDFAETSYLKHLTSVHTGCES